MVVVHGLGVSVLSSMRQNTGFTYRRSLAESISYNGITLLEKLTCSILGTLWVLTFKSGGHVGKILSSH